MRGFSLLSLVFASEDYVRFPAIGDWGGADPIPVIYPGGNRYSQEWGAASMDKLCGERDCDFMLSLGDNFYWDGVYNIDDIRFNGTYENIYGFASERENIKNLDFYQCLGNHDHRRNATAQVRFKPNRAKKRNFQVIYSHQRETNFKFPDLWYSFTVGDNNDHSYSKRVSD